MFPRWWDRSYRRISTDSLSEKQSESNDGLEERQPERIQQHRQFTLTTTRNIIVLVVATCGIAVFVALGLYGLHRTNGKDQNEEPIRLCGNSSAEALSLGCSWDQLTWSWYPPSCPHYANDEFLNAEPWKFYGDPHGKELVVTGSENWTKALDNQKDLWGERREHLTHCVYVFLSLGQIIRDGTSYPPKLVRYEHLHHCGKIILESLRQDKNWNKIETFVGEASYDELC